MNIDGLPIIGRGVDYTQVGAIHQKRTLAFINHFISNTVSFLNKFSRSCEQRLEKFDARIQKINASLCILEAKLSSISALESVSDECEVTESGKASDISSSDIPVENKSIDPRLEKYYRMVQVGVPLQVIHLKMEVEGLDPSLLNNKTNSSSTVIVADAGISSKSESCSD